MHASTLKLRKNFQDMSLSDSGLNSASIKNELIFFADRQLQQRQQQQHLTDDELAIARPRSISPIDLKHLNKLLKLSSSSLKKQSTSSSPVDDDKTKIVITEAKADNNAGDDDDDEATVPTILTPTASPSLGVAS